MNTSTNSTQHTSGRILIIDDEEKNRMLLRDPLEMHGYEVREAKDGLDALEQIAAQLPEVILLDVMMPRMHGFDLCQRLKQTANTASIPILMVTALGDRHERLMGIKVGANDFLTKPVDLQDLVLRVGNAVKLKRLHDQLNAEQKRSACLLYNTLPEPIAKRMLAGETMIADFHAEATVLFADLVGFTALSAHIGPGQVVYLLDEIFALFDGLVAEHGLEKIKTLGDGYMVAGGVPAPRLDHASAVTELALAMRDAMAEFNRQYTTTIQIRFGICTGPLVAGVIGRKKFSYDIWGQTVNHACRLGSSGEGGTISVAPTTREFIQDQFEFDSVNAGQSSGKGIPAGFKLVRRVMQTNETPDTVLAEV